MKHTILAFSLSFLSLSPWVRVAGSTPSPTTAANIGRPPAGASGDGATYPRHPARPSDSLLNPDYYELVDQVLPAPGPTPGWANTWSWWASLRILGPELQFGQILATLRKSHNGHVTLVASVVQKSLDAALGVARSSHTTVDLERLAREAEVTTLRLSTQEEPELGKLASRLEGLTVQALPPLRMTSDEHVYQLWVDTSAGESVFLSTALPPKKLAEWVADLRGLILSRIRGASGLERREGLSKP